MTNLFLAAIAPVLICIFYIYIRDKYEKEPVRLLGVGVIFGVIITFPIIFAETIVTSFMPISGLLFEAFYMSFIVASLVEEGFKYIVLFILTWRNKNLNERFDGIVYSVFISLGFAGVENILYVFNPEMGGMSTAFARAIFSVPGHAFFGVMMGYYFSMAKLEPEKRVAYLIRGFFVAWFVHGLYDFILLSQPPYVMAIFIPFFGVMAYNGFRKMKIHLANSPFKSHYQQMPDKS